MNITSLKNVLLVCVIHIIWPPLYKSRITLCSILDSANKANSHIAGQINKHTHTYIHILLVFEHHGLLNVIESTKKT